MAEGGWSKTGRTMPIHGCFQSASNFQIGVAWVCNSNGKQGFGRLPRQLDRALLDSERGVTRATCHERRYPTQRVVGPVLVAGDKCVDDGFNKGWRNFRWPHLGKIE